MSPLQQPDRTFPVLLACAFRLTDAALVHPGAEPLAPQTNEPQRLAGLLQEHPPGLDPITATDAVTYAETLSPTPRACLAHLANTLVALHNGRPVTLHHTAGPAVLRVVESDALVAWHLATQSHPDLRATYVTWPPVLPETRGHFDALLNDHMAEGHSHLGGALPTSLYWTVALGQLLPLFYGSDPKHQALWHQRLREAADDLAAIIAILRGEDACPDRGARPPRGRSESPAAGGFDGPRLGAKLAAFACPEGLREGDPDGLLARWPISDARVNGSAVLAGLAGERRVLCAALNRLPPHGESSPLEERLFRYLRVKNAFHWALLLRPGARGLARFQTTFRRRSFYFRPAMGNSPRKRRIAAGLEQRRMEQVLECYLWDASGELPFAGATPIPPLDVELRVSLEPRRKAAVATLLAWLRALRNVVRESPWAGAPLRVGLVVHFLRRDPGYSAAFAEWQAEGLMGWLNNEPLLRPLIVGVDVAGEEMGVPPRSFARTFRRVRELQDQCKLVAGVPPVRLGFTYHAGEDFRDLATGLRHVDEVAHLLDMRPGDRIGHGLALAFPPAAFYERRSVVLPRRADHVVDLLWLWHLFRSATPADPEHATRARQRLCRLLGAAGIDISFARLERILQRKMTPDGPWPRPSADVCSAARAGGLPANCTVATEAEVLEAIAAASHLPERDAGSTYTGVATVDERSATAEREAAVRWLLDPNQPATIPDLRPEWIDLVDAAQRLVRRRILAKGLTVELNPTSNLLIGAFRDYEDLPYTTLNATGRGAPSREEGHIPVSLNTDDAGLFHTTLREEHRRYGRALIQSGYLPHEAQAWIDEARRVGVRSSFIPPWAPRGENLARHIDRILKKEWDDPPSHD
jgi:adenosine deaminase